MVTDQLSKLLTLRFFIGIVQAPVSNLPCPLFYLPQTRPPSFPAFEPRSPLWIHCKIRKTNQAAPHPHALLCHTPVPLAQPACQGLSTAALPLRLPQMTMATTGLIAYIFTAASNVQSAFPTHKTLGYASAHLNLSTTLQGPGAITEDVK